MACHDETQRLDRVVQGEEMTWREKRLLFPIIRSLRIARKMAAEEEDKSKDKAWDRLIFILEVLVLKVARGDYEGLEVYQKETADLMKILQ